MQTLRRKNSPCKFKNEPTRFLGEGVSFKAKLIGILEVSEARGDSMCQAALADLKMAIRAAGEHKQRITVQISIDGLRLRNEKTGDCQYHHPVHKISFIAQDISDPRAFGYIFGSPDMGHRFFGIKTDKSAGQVVIAMRDLFQVVFELKKKEIEQAKLHIEQTTIKFHPSGIFVEPSPDTKGAAGSETSHHRTISEVEKSIGRKHESQSGVVADLLDLQFELNSLQQGIRQMDKITPDNPRPSEDPFDADPFGDSFANMKVKDNVQPILPPPPSSRKSHLDRQQSVQQTSTSSSSSPVTTVTSKSPPPYGSTHWFDKETEDLFTDGELSNLSRNLGYDKDKDSDSSTPRSYYKSQQVDVFTELDPLGTGSKKPYVDKKDFFQHLKNPPKKVLKDLATTSSSETFPADFRMSNINDPIEPVKVQNTTSSSENYDDNSFANFEKFNEDETSPRTSSPLLKKESSPRNNYQPLSVSLPPEEERQKSFSSTSNTSILTKMDRDSTESTQGLIKLPSPRKYLQYSRKDYGMDSRTQSIEKPFPIDFSNTSDSPASPLKSCSSEATSRLSNSSVEMDNVPEPPPRGSGSIMINPPPLPPKKQSSRGAIKPPPRPPYTEGHFHYDFLEREEGSPSPTRKERNKSPTRDIKSRFDDNFSPPMPQLPKRSEQSTLSDSSFEDSFSSIIPPSLSTLFQNSGANQTSDIEVKKPKLPLYITLSQLTASNLSELATSLNMSVDELTNLRLQQLTECLAELCLKEAIGVKKASTPVVEKATKAQSSAKMVETAFVSNEPLFKANFDQESKLSDSTYDKYAVFRELLQTEKNDLGRNGSDSIDTEISEDSRPPEDEEFETNNKMDNIVSLKNLTVKLPPLNDSLLKREQTSDEEVRREFPETKIDNIMSSRKEDKEEEEEEKKLSRDSSKDSEEGTEQEDQIEDGEEVLKKSQSENSDKDSPPNETEISSEKVEIKQSTSTSSDRYAALREIMDTTEQVSLDIETESTNYITSPIKTSPIKKSSRKTSPVKISPAKTKPSAEIDLMSLFSDTPPQLPPKNNIKKDTKAVMDIFEEIKMLNVETPTSVNKSMAGFEDVFCPLSESKSIKEEVKEEENWAKFDTNVFHSEKSYGENHGSVGGTSPWSPDGKEFYKEPPTRTGIQRHSGESDNEWKDEEESEESNGRYKAEGVPYGRPPYGMNFEERAYYEENMEPGDKDRSFRDKMGKKTRGVPWSKPGHRLRDPTPWHEDSRWEEERKRHLHRKIPYKDEEEYKAYWKCRHKQRPWNGDREGFWPHDDPYYEEERNKRRLMLWNEERDSRERFSSQESMVYEDEERWSRREYERRRWEADGTYCSRMYGKHDPHYGGRDARHYDYPPAWEEDYGPERTDDSPRYASRKRHWPKRPNSANDGRNQEVYCSGPPLYSMSRSECSDNDSDPYHRPHRSRSRDSYWGSDQEFDSWGERPYWSEGTDAKNDSFHKRRMPRRTRVQAILSQNSPFEDDFTQPGERNEPSVDSLSTEPRTRIEVELKKSPSPKNIKEPGKRETRSHKSSSYFEDDLTPTASASSDASDRPRLGSDLKATPEELPSDIKDQDTFVNEESSRDSFYNGDQRFDDDAFTFRSELEDQVSEKTTLKNSRSNKYTSNKIKSDQYIKKSESVNIFARENDPFDDDEFFN